MPESARSSRSRACRLSSASSALLVVFLGFGFAGCGTTSDYPKLRDIPAAPKLTTPPTERDQLKEDLGNERGGSSRTPPVGPGAEHPTDRQPAVPPRPRKAPGRAGLNAPWLEPQECGPPAGSLAAEAIPPLRGTLRDPVRPSAREPQGLTAAIPAPAEPLVLEFEPGTAELPWPVLGAFKERVAALLTPEGGLIMIDASGSRAPHNGDTVRSLDNLILGLRRASAIADLLISQGAQPDRIKLVVTAEEAPRGSAPNAPDTAQIRFQRAR